MSLKTPTTSHKPLQYKRSRSQLDLLLERQKQINKFDYDKMISDFDMESRHKTLMNKIKQKWGMASERYHEKIQEMKAKNEEQYKQKERAFKKKIKAKEESIEKVKKMQELQLSEERKKKGELTKKKSEDVMKNIRKIEKKKEDARLSLEHESLYKSKK